MHTRIPHAPQLAVLTLVALATACSDSADPTMPETDGLGPAASMGSAHGDVVEAVTGAAHAFGTLNGVPFPRYLQFNARRFEDGAVEGEAHLVTGTIQWHGDVTCFTLVTENRVWLGVRADQISDPRGILFPGGPPPVLDLFAVVVDNGEGAVDPDDTTSAVVIGGPGRAEELCETGFDGLADVELTSGNVQVH